MSGFYEHFCPLHKLLLPEAKHASHYSLVSALWFRYISVTPSFGRDPLSGIRSQSI